MCVLLALCVQYRCWDAFEGISRILAAIFLASVIRQISGFRHVLHILESGGKIWHYGQTFSTCNIETVHLDLHTLSVVL